MALLSFTPSHQPNHIWLANISNFVKTLHVTFQYHVWKPTSNCNGHFGSLVAIFNFRELDTTLNASVNSSAYRIQILAQAACMRHACLRAPCDPCVAWPLLLPSFSISFFLSFSLRHLLLTHFRNFPCVKICFPKYFGITRK